MTSPHVDAELRLRPGGIEVVKWFKFGGVVGVGLLVGDGCCGEQTRSKYGSKRTWK